MDNFFEAWKCWNCDVRVVSAELGQDMDKHLSIGRLVRKILFRLGKSQSSRDQGENRWHILSCISSSSFLALSVVHRETDVLSILRLSAISIVHNIFIQIVRRFILENERCYANTTILRCSSKTSSRTLLKKKKER